MSVQQRESWFQDFDPARRPLWVWCDAAKSAPRAWLSLRSCYGRPASRATVEVAVYTAPEAQRRGLARTLLSHALDQAPGLGVRTILACVFGHNAPSLALFRNAGFEHWGRLPGVAELDGVERDLVILGRAVPG